MIPLTDKCKTPLYWASFLTFNEYASEPHKNILKLAHVVRLDIFLSLIEDAC
jgi:hypothetical protein